MYRSLNVTGDRRAGHAARIGTEIYTFIVVKCERKRLVAIPRCRQMILQVGKFRKSVRVLTRRAVLLQIPLISSNIFTFCTVDCCRILAPKYSLWIKMD
jgi:hypothetical protein